MKPDLSVIIVHYNEPDLLLKCIRSIEVDKGDILIEYIIVDNSSNAPLEGISEISENTRYFDQGYNSGFARAINVGLKNAGCDLIMLINQDAFFVEDVTLKRLINKFKTLPDKTIMGCKLAGINDEYQQTIWIDEPGIKREWLKSAINCKLNPEWKARQLAAIKSYQEKEGFVHRINAAFLLFQFQHGSGIYFDEDFFLYGEDVEWAYRIRKKGYKFYYYPDVLIAHLGSSASSNELIKQMQILVSSWLYLRKAKGRIYMIIYLLIASLNLILDYMLNYIKFEVRSTNSINRYHSFKKEQKIKWYLIRKYFFKLAFNKHLSLNEDFIANCYKNESEYVRKISFE